MGVITLEVGQQDNQPPNQSGWLSLNLDYNETHVFTVANFTTETTPPYQDPEGDPMESIKITSLPIKGVLKIGLLDVLAGDIITFGEITAGDLTYESDALEVQGYSDSRMRFLISDTGSSTFTTSPQVITIIAGTNENDPPSVIGNGEHEMTLGSSFTFTREALTTNLSPPYEDPEGDIASRLRVNRIPTYGVLLLNGVPVVNDQIISFTDIDNLLLVYQNNGNPGANPEGFEFEISDVGSEIFRG